MTEMELIRAVFRADEARDVAGFLALLAPGAVMRIGGGPQLEGHAAINSALVELFAGLRAGIVHRLIQLWPAPANRDSFAYQAEAIFALPDGRDLVLPYVNVVRRDSSGLIEDYRIHIDLSSIGN